MKRVIPIFLIILMTFSTINLSLVLASDSTKTNKNATKTVKAKKKATTKANTKATTKATTKPTTKGTTNTKNTTSTETKVNSGALVSDSEESTEAFNRMVSLGILSNNKVQGDLLTREEYSIAIVVASGLSETAKQTKASVVFSDVSSKSTALGYINIALKKGYISGRADGKFHGLEAITFAELCTSMVRALRYTDQDIAGLWPNNYLEKANYLKLTENIELKYNDKVTASIAALMFDRLLGTNVKKANANDEDKSFADVTGINNQNNSYGLYTDCVILGNSLNVNKLTAGQVLTDKGIYTIPSDITVDIGGKYRLNIKNNKLQKVFYKLNTLESIIVDNVVDGNITYFAEDKVENLNLSDKITYYYQGVKQSYDNLKNLLKPYATVFLAKGKLDYEYAVISDPIYSKATVVTNFNPADKKLGNIDLSDNPKLIKNGEIIDVTQIMDKDVAYQVSDIQNKKRYILLLDNKVLGKITGILPNKISPKTIQLNNVNYEIGKDMNSLSSYSFKVDDSVTLLLGYDGKIVDVIYGVYMELTVLGNALTIDKLSDNQVLTDKGTYILGNNVKLEVGNKYRIQIDSNNVISSYYKLNEVEDLVITNVVDSKITYEINGKVENLYLPDKISYFLKGEKLSYDNIKNVLQPYSTITFAKNKEGYEYAIISNPVYSKPQIVSNFNPLNKKIGSIDFADNPKIIKNGELIDFSLIMDKDVVYQISDIRGLKRYILVVDKKVQGKLTAILPNKLSPKILQIDNQNYEISKDMYLTNLIDPLKINDEVILSTGYDNKVLNVNYSIPQTNSNYALVLNYGSYTSTNITDNGKIIYTVKLILSSGTIASYKTVNDATNLKGRLVTYTKTDEQTVTLIEVINNNSAETTIRKSNNQINNNFITGDVKIFNIIANEQGLDVKAKLIAWNELPTGTLPAAKVLFINKYGLFEDVNVIFTEDIFNEKYKLAYVKNIDSATSKKTTTYNYKLLIDGKEYDYSNSNFQSIATGNVLKIQIFNNISFEVKEIKAPIVEATTVQAIDGKRIKVNNTIYQFEDNVVIYFKDSLGNITLKTPNDILTSSAYGKVSIYVDNISSETSKVEMIIISQ